MTIHKCLLVTSLALLFVLTAEAQGYNIGIRAGLGQSKFNGPLETGESYGLTGGFHFGLNFQWNFNEFIGLRSEVLYSQTGSTYKLEVPDGYYVFVPCISQNAAVPCPPSLTEKIVIRDSSLVNLDHSNAYIQLPQTLHIRLTRKFDVFVGGYIGFLISPIATGTHLFGGSQGLKEHSFLQGLNFEYFNDDATTKNGSLFNPRPEVILIRAEGRNVDLRDVENSFDYQSFSTDQSRFLSIDYGLIFGGSYYFNRGLYVMGRVEYGVRDITRNTADFSFVQLGPDAAPVFNNDNDRNLGFFISMGFQF